MENDDGVGGIGDIDDSALDDAEKADAEDKSNENDNAGGQGTSEIKNELEQALQETLGQNFLNSKDMEDLMMGMVGEEPPEVKQEADATSGQEAGAGTSVSGGQPEINVKTEMTGNAIPKTELMSPTGQPTVQQPMETQASPQLPSQQQQVNISSSFQPQMALLLRSFQFSTKNTRTRLTEHFLVIFVVITLVLKSFITLG